MNPSLKAIITLMLNKKFIGGKHTSEEKMIQSKTKWLQKEEYDNFEREYRNAINNQLILRTKKKTGKGSDWHIWLNPRKLKELYEMIR
ncbi:MAG: hypothetical protein NTV63_01915 [Candidatus Woesearchaeota archaeon]|nr:hypothetical protein [Candidatus Woesearchaeota archaeon]